MTINGPTLRLNLNTGALGELRIGLVEPATGRELSGFAADDCEPMQINATGVAVRWKSGGDLAAHQGRPVQLKFAGARTKLYSFRFA